MSILLLLFVPEIAVLLLLDWILVWAFLSFILFKPAVDLAVLKLFDILKGFLFVTKLFLVTGFVRTFVLDEFLLSESVEAINAFLLEFPEDDSIFFSFSFVTKRVWLDVAVSLNFLNKKSGFDVFFRLFDITVEIELSCNCWLLLEFSLVANPARPLNPLVTADVLIGLPLVPFEVIL